MKRKMRKSRVKAVRCAVAAAALVFGTSEVEAKTVAIADVGARYEKDLSVLEATIAEAGHEIKKITGNSYVMENPETYEGVDVVFITGGWNDGYFPTVGACRQLVRFAAKGGGVFLGAFRAGAVRTGGFAPLPEVARTINRCNSPWLKGFGDSPLAKAFGEKPIKFGGWDHIVMRPGELGNVFVKCGDDPVGAFGSFGFGRVVVLGVFLYVSPSDAELAAKKAVLRSIVDYLAGATPPPASDAGVAKAVDEAETAFKRRMIIHEWMHDERGDSYSRGILTAMRDDTVIPVEGKAMLLEYFAKELTDKALAAQCGGLAKKVREVSNGMRRLCDEKCAEVRAEVAAMKGEDIVFNEAACGRPTKGRKWFETPKLDAKKAACREEFDALAAKCPAEAAELIEKARVAIRAQRKEALAVEHKEDLKSLPSLVARLSATDEAVRLDAATELGRIGEATPEVVAALVKALDDADDKVAVQAAISLGWMQSKDAVPALIAKAHQNDNLPLKRRAIQALGQIGDDRAIPEVFAALDSADRYSVENAILSLGWLRAKEAVPRLIEIASDESLRIFLTAYDEKKARDFTDLRKVKQDMASVNKREGAAIALGMIGDKSAVPALEKIAASSPGYISDCKAMTAHLGASFKVIANEAIAQINAGGRAEKGVRQPEALSSKSAFYAMLRRNNSLCGRLHSVTGKMAGFAGDKEALTIPYLLDAGFTGVHDSWGERTFRTDEVLEGFIRDMDDFGMSFVNIAPGKGFASLCDLNRASQERTFARIGDCAAYAGVWSEENWPNEKTRYIVPESEDSSVCELGAAARAARVAALEEYGADIETNWREAQDWLHGRRKGFAITYSLTEIATVRPIGGQAAFSRIDVRGNESYESFGRFIAYFAERIRNGDAVPVMSEYYNWYSPSNAHVLRGCWLAAIHSKCYYPFAFNQFAPFLSTYDSWSWDRGRWEQYAKVQRHVRANEELYAVSPSATEVAVLMSERSAASFKHSSYRPSENLEDIEQNGVAVWTALSQSHVNADVVFIDNATEKKLAKYKVLFLTTAKILTEREQALLRKWVADGGTLVCEGAVALFDAKNLMRRCNYAIADVLGANYVKTEFVKSSEVYVQRKGANRTNRIVHADPDLENFYNFSEHVWRDFKPTDCIAVADGVEYDASLGIDRVELNGAKAVQTFSDGSPALTVNEYGKGRAYLFTAMRPAYGHVTSCWEMKPNKFDFWPGVRETYEKLAREGLAHAGTEQAVDLVGAHKDVELTVYSQNGGDRLVVHLLDYDVKSEKVSGASLRINGSRPIKAVYRPGGKRFAPSGRTVALGTFEVYDMIVVEF